jgi:predicted nucleic acid-binding protein
MSGLCLDAGALIAFERGDRAVVGRLARAVALGLPVVIPAGALAQAWRDGARQARLARLVEAEGVIVEALDHGAARAAGQLCGRAKTRDVVDAHVALCARRGGHLVLTSDPDDLRRLDPSIRLAAV